MIKKVVLFLAGILVLILVEIARVYFIMPFPGSQEDNTIELAYFLNNYIWVFRIVGIALVSYPAYWFITKGEPTYKWTAVALLLFWLGIVYMFNFRFLADKMFYQPENKILVDESANKVSTKNLVLGVAVNGDAKAYPIEIIGYHHQVRDTVGGVPVMVTYCTVCRTGRVYKPEVDGKPENFRLVGMDHFNAMFEDSRTKSWWRQVSGEAIVGELKGKALPEIPSEQMTLGAWLDRHPASLVLQPDEKFKNEYAELEKYDEGEKEGSLERTDSISWQKKSWVVGVSLGLYARAYDWIELEKVKVINDELQGTPLLITLENDSASFHVWNRIVGNDTLEFVYSDSLKTFVDTKTKSIWTSKGTCKEGELANAELTPVQAYQEYWHSWQTFHPNTTQFKVGTLE